MKVLFVVTAFYPEQAIGSIRISKFAKYMQKMGASISVISLEPPHWAKRDESLYFKGLETIRWDVIDQSWIFKKIFQKIRVATIGTVPANAVVTSSSSGMNIKMRIRSIAHFTYTLLKAIDWLIIVRKHAKKNIINEDYDFIFCSYPSFASPLTGIQLKKLGIGKKLITDFRDPILDQRTSSLNPKHWLQKFILRNADMRFFISEGVKNQVCNDIKSSNNLIVPNGFDLRDIDSLSIKDTINTSKNKLRFVYTGAIYGGKRDLKPFFRCISNIFKNSKHTPNQVRFDYAGKEGDIFISQAAEYGLQDHVFDHGLVSRSDSLLLQQQSDICLLATWNTKFEQGCLTGKVFEYFMFKKPVLAIVAGNLGGSEMFQITEKIGAGHCFESATQNSEKSLEIWLENALDEKKITGTLKNNYNDMVKEFNIEEIVQNVLKRMNKILEHKAS